MRRRAGTGGAGGRGGRAGTAMPFLLVDKFVVAVCAALPGNARELGDGEEEAGHNEDILVLPLMPLLLLFLL